MTCTFKPAMFKETFSGRRRRRFHWTGGFWKNVKTNKALNKFPVNQVNLTSSLHWSRPLSKCRPVLKLITAVYYMFNVSYKENSTLSGQPRSRLMAGVSWVSHFWRVGPSDVVAAVIVVLNSCLLTLVWMSTALNPVQYWMTKAAVCVCMGVCWKNIMGCGMGFSQQWIKLNSNLWTSSIWKTYSCYDMGV